MSHWRDMADRLDGKAPPGAARSSEWQSVRNDFLRGRSCAVCGGRRFLIAHHIVPFHLAPDLELDPTNLIALCEAKRYGINCHLLLGHLGNYQRANPFVEAFAAEWNHLLVQGQ
jgi:5-methylcytosine-specific restriction enzyme A